MSTNPVFAKQEKLLGTDVMVDQNGSFATRYVQGFHDLATIAGEANLNQALINRLKAVAKGLGSKRGGSLPAHPDYGAGAYTLVSSPWNEARQKLQTVIITNFASEPRIKPLQASDVTFTWDPLARTLTVEISYTRIKAQVPQNLIFPIYL